MLTFSYNDFKKPWRIKEYLSFFLGVTSTMPIVGINIGQTDISLFKIFFFSFMLYTGFESCKNGLMITNASKFFQFWLLLCVFSGLCGCLFLRNSAPEWSSVAENSIVRIVPFLLFSLFWSSYSNNDEMNNAVIKGFLYGCLANCAWTIIDAGGYYLLGKSINNIVFSGYISRHGIRYDALSLVSSATGSIRSGGFNSDPAHIGFLAPILFGFSVMKKNYGFLFIAVGAVLASASTTALVCSVLVTLFCLKYVKCELKLDKRSFGRYVLTFIFFIVVFISIKEKLTIFANSSFTSFYNRVDGLYLQNADIADDLRIGYLLYMPFAVFEMIPFVFFGSGIGTSSLGYAKSLYIPWNNKITNAFDMENSYIAYFLDTGIAGFIVYILMLGVVYKNVKKNIKENFSVVNITAYVTLLNVFFSAFFYHYILFAPEMLMLIIMLSKADRKGNFYV